MTTFESKAILNAFRRQNWRGRKMMQYFKEFLTNQREGAYKNEISLNPSKIKTTALNQYYVLTNHYHCYKNFVLVMLNNGTSDIVYKKWMVNKNSCKCLPKKKSISLEQMVQNAAEHKQSGDCMGAAFFAKKVVIYINREVLTIIKSYIYVISGASDVQICKQCYFAIANAILSKSNI